jgi:hypothetical protein
MVAQGSRLSNVEDTRAHTKALNRINKQGFDFSSVRVNERVIVMIDVKGKYYVPAGR